MATDNLFRILLIEDSDGDAELVANYVEELGKGDFSLRRAANLAEGRAALAEESFHLVLLDLHLPDSEGLETLDAVCADCDGKSAMVVVLTGTDDEEMTAESLRRCAQNYLVKGEINPNSLMRAIRMAVGQHARDRLPRIERDVEQAPAPAAAKAADDALEILRRVNKVSAPGSEDLGDQADPTVLAHELSTASRASGAVLVSLSYKMDDVLAQLKDLRASHSTQAFQLRRIEEANKERDLDRLKIVAAIRRLQEQVKPMTALVAGTGVPGPLHARLISVENFVAATLTARAADQLARDEDRKMHRRLVVVLISGMVAWAGAFVTAFAHYYFRSPG